MLGTGLLEEQEFSTDHQHVRHPLIHEERTVEGFVPFTVLDETFTQSTTYNYVSFEEHNPQVIQTALAHLQTEGFSLEEAQLIVAVSLREPNMRKFFAHQFQRDHEALGFRQAYQIAANEHRHDDRKQINPDDPDGRPYNHLEHVTGVASILANLGYSYREGIAALFHDVFEKRGDTFGIVNMFDEVDDVLALTDFTDPRQAHSKTEQKNQFSLEFLTHVIRNPALSVIKGADRLHNLLSFDAYGVEAQRRIYSETLDVYLPVIEALDSRLHAALVHRIAEIEEQSTIPLQRYNPSLDEFNLTEAVVAAFSSRFSQDDTVGKRVVDYVNTKSESLEQVTKEYLDRIIDSVFTISKGDFYLPNKPLEGLHDLSGYWNKVASKKLEELVHKDCGLDFVREYFTLENMEQVEPLDGPLHQLLSEHGQYDSGVSHTALGEAVQHVQIHYNGYFEDLVQSLRSAEDVPYFLVAYDQRFAQDDVRDPSIAQSITFDRQGDHSGMRMIFDRSGLAADIDTYRDGDFSKEVKDLKDPFLVIDVLGAHR